jgi:hypothetical protein
MNRKGHESCLEEVVSVEEVYSPLSECVCVAPGLISGSILDTLDQRDFDQAPVYDDKTRVCYGLVSWTHLKKLHDAGTPLRTDDAVINKNTLIVGSQTNVFDIVRALKRDSSAIVVEALDGTEYGYVEQPRGLLTISDLNKHAIRGALYRLISETEANIAELVEHHFDKSWDWIALLNEKHQVQVLGYWELSKKRDVDIGPIAAVTLSNLITIIEKSPSLRSRLGYNSRKEFEQVAGKIPEFRNRTMHPVRPLVLGDKDVEQLEQVMLFLKDLKTRCS